MVTGCGDCPSAVWEEGGWKDSGDSEKRQGEKRIVPCNTSSRWHLGIEIANERPPTWGWPRIQNTKYLIGFSLLYIVWRSPSLILKTSANLFSINILLLFLVVLWRDIEGAGPHLGRSMLVNWEFKKTKSYKPPWEPWKCWEDHWTLYYMWIGDQANVFGY